MIIKNENISIDESNIVDGEVMNEGSLRLILESLDDPIVIFRNLNIEYKKDDNTIIITGK